MLTVQAVRAALHSADEPPRVTWEVPDDARLSDLAVLAVGTRFLLRQAPWHLFRGRRVVMSVSWVGDGREVEVAIWRRGDSRVARVFPPSRQGDPLLYWDDNPTRPPRWGARRFVPRWWERPRLKVDAEATTRARAADATGSLRADG